MVILPIIPFVSSRPLNGVEPINCKDPVDQIWVCHERAHVPPSSHSPCTLVWWKSCPTGIVVLLLYFSKMETCHVQERYAHNRKYSFSFCIWIRPPVLSWIWIVSFRVQGSRSFSRVHGCSHLSRSGGGHCPNHPWTWFGAPPPAKYLIIQVLCMFFS